MSTTKAIDALGTQAAYLAMKGALDLLESKGSTPEELRAEPVARLDALASLVMHETKAALPGALEDARTAVACGMGQMASATFRASMVLAGIRAAKRFLLEVA